MENNDLSISSPTPPPTIPEGQQGSEGTPKEGFTMVTGHLLLESPLSTLFEFCICWH